MNGLANVSIIMPVFNEKKTLENVLDKIISLKPKEIIIVDDGSTDSTRRIVEAYGEKVRYVYQSNAGVSAARNRGANEARYRWIAFLDSDDYWLPHHLRRMVDAIAATEGRAALYFCDIQRPAEEGGWHHWDVCGFKINGPFEFKHDASEWALLRIQPMMTPASVIRRRIYLELGGLPEGLRTREDTLLFYKLGLTYPACAVLGCGAVMMGDDYNRLTQIHGSNSLVYGKASVFIYEELLKGKKNISRERQRFLTNSLGTAYFSLGRVYFRRKEYPKVIKNLCISFGISPISFAKEFIESAARYSVKKSNMTLRSARRKCKEPTQEGN